MRENIHKFGGDKDKVTIFGQSAGGWSVSSHLLSSLSKGLFKRAIVSSGANYHKRGQLHVSTDDALVRAKQLAKSLSCSDDKQWLACLKNISAHDIIYMANLNGINPVEGTEFLPVNAQKAFEHGEYNKGMKNLVFNQT